MHTVVLKVTDSYVQQHVLATLSYTIIVSFLKYALCYSFTWYSTDMGACDRQCSIIVCNVLL